MDKQRERLPRLRLTIQNKLLPYRDLDIKGDPQRYLELGHDVIFTLTGLIGLNESEPRLVRIGDNGALLTSNIGGAFNASLTTQFSSETGPSDTILAPTGTGAMILGARSTDVYFHVLGVGQTVADVIILTAGQTLEVPVAPISVYMEGANPGDGCDGFFTFLYRVPTISAAGS
jgi:hypothetical protein